MNAHHEGASLKQAAKQTFTGRMAERLGLTSVDVSRVNWALETEYPTLVTVFKCPDFGTDRAWNDYANAWVLARGRPRLEVMPRTIHAEPPKPVYPIPPQLLQAVGRLPDEQREVVLRRLQENYAKQSEAATDITPPGNDHGHER